MIVYWIVSNKMVELVVVGDYLAIVDCIDKIEYVGQEWVVNIKIQKVQIKMVICIGEVSVGMEKEGDVNYYVILIVLFLEVK